MLIKYPIYLDVHVGEYGKYNPNKKICYEVFLIVSNEDYENKDFKIDTVIHLASKMASGNNLNDVGVLTDNIKMTENKI